MRLLDEPARIVGGSILFKGRDLAHLDDEGIRKVRGREIAMVFQDPMTSLNPVLRIARQLDRGDDGARPLYRGGGAQPRDRSAAAHGRGLGRPHCEFVPASILRWHAPARDAGHGLLQRAFPAHRGRTDHGARRDHPGADPGPAARAEPRPWHRRHPDQPRPRRDRQYLLARAGDVRRRGGRGRRARGSADRSAPSLHLGAAARRAADRCADRGSPADHHRGPAAGPARLAIRLPLSGALPLCHREMRGASRAAAGGSAGAPRGAG